MMLQLLPLKLLSRKGSNAAEEKVSILPAKSNVAETNSCHASRPTHIVAQIALLLEILATDDKHRYGYNSFPSSSGDASSAGEGEAMKPLEFMKNQLALCELKLRRAHKNYHELSKRTRQLETENVRARRTCWSYRTALNCVKSVAGQEKSQLKLETAHKMPAKKLQN